MNAHDEANALLRDAIHKHAVEVDTELARIWQEEAQYRRYAREQADRRNRDNGRWFDQDRYDEYVAKIEACRAEARPYEDEYAMAGGWSRFYLCVTSGQGHIHSSTHCPTTYVTTSFAWLPSLSGLTEADAVADQGEILCSVCYPSAPVAWTQGVSKATLAEREARAVAKAERQAKKVAKALYPEDPERGLRLPEHHDTIRTIAAAKMHLTDAAEWARIYEERGDEGYHPSYPPEETQAVAEALAHRTETTVEQVMTDAFKRAEKRAR